MAAVPPGTIPPPPPGTLDPKPAPTNHAPSGPWYSAYPIPQVARQQTPVNVYTFASKSLEAQVFTHASPANTNSWPSPNNGGLRQQQQQQVGAGDNAPLQWLGSSIVQSLASQLLMSLYAGQLGIAGLADLRAAITSRSLQAHIAQTLQLPARLSTAQANIITSQRVLSDLFDAFIGGLSVDLTSTRSSDLYTFYYALLLPYATSYHALYLAHLSSPPSAVGTGGSSSSSRKRQELAPFTSRLMEYAAKNKLDAPGFEFTSKGEGQEIRWSCTVVLRGVKVARSEAQSKGEAKHMASMEALKVLPQQQQQGGMGVAGGQDREARRKRKEGYRKRAAVAAGVGPQGMLAPGVGMGFAGPS